MQRKELFLLLMLMLACLSQNLSQVSAQDAATQNDAEATAKGESEDLWERLIYLPYKNLKEVFEKQDATVFMPYLEYLKLWQGQAAGPEGEIKPPVSALITSAIYKATIEKNFARIEVEYSIQVLGKPWSEIPLNFAKGYDEPISSFIGLNSLCFNDTFLFTICKYFALLGILCRSICTKSFLL